MPVLEPTYDLREPGLCLHQVDARTISGQATLVIPTPHLDMISIMDLEDLPVNLLG
jgi:hypothetical protein